MPCSSSAGALLALALTVTCLGTASAQAVPPDVVRTRDGAMYRGVIVENVPNDHVLLLMPNGETRRILAAEILSTEIAPTASTVTATTPAPAASTSAAPTSAADRSDVVVGRGRLRFAVVSDLPGLTLHGAGIGLQPARICFERCELHMDPGHYRFAVEDSDARLRPTRGSLLLDRDGELRVSIRSRRKARAILGVMGLVLGLASIPIWTADGRFEREDSYGVTGVKPSFIIPGSLMLGLSVVFLGSAIGIRDQGQVDFAPY